MNGDRRPGDNLWTNSVLALRPETGERVWEARTFSGVLSTRAPALLPPAPLRRATAGGRRGLPSARSRRG